MFVLFHPPGCLLSLFRCAFRCFFAVWSLSCFRLLLRCLVLASLLTYFFLLSLVASPTVVLLSLHYSLSSGGICLLFRLSCHCLVVVQYSHVSFFSLWVCLFLCFASTASFLHLSSLLSFHSALLGFVFLFFFCCLLRSIVSSLYSLLPFLRCGGSSLHKFRVSCFPSYLFCSASAFTGYYFHCFLCFRLGVLFFFACWSPLTRVPVSVFACRLLRRFFATRRCPILAIGFAFFVSFFFLLICLSSSGSASIPQRFSCLSLVYFLGPCVVTCDFPFSSSPFGSFALALGLRCLPCGLFATVGFLLFFLFFLLCSSVSIAVLRFLLSSLWLHM